MADLAFNHNAIHTSAQNLQQLAQDCLSAHAAQWQQIQNGMASFPAEMYFPNLTCSDHWQTFAENLYQHHLDLSGHIDKAATDLHALDDDVANSFTDTIGMPNFGLFS